MVTDLLLTGLVLTPPPPAKDDVDEVPDPKFSKATTTVFDKIYNGKDGVFSSSKFVDLIETFRKVFIVKN